VFLRIRADSGASAPSEQIHSGFALVIGTFAVPDFNIPDRSRTAAKRNRWSASTRTNHSADWQHLLTSVAEADHHTLEVNSSISNSECEGREGRITIDVDFVVIRATIYVSVSKVLPSADEAASAIGAVTSGPTATILAGQQRRQTD
jgi:hypothetical protein